MTKLKHVGLTVVKDDIQNFYIDILGFRAEGEFQLNYELSESIFNIKNDIEVRYLVNNEVTLELFIFPNPVQHQYFQHLCFQMENCEEIYEKALEKNYWSFRRTNSKNQSTYFIKDNMNNLFELKNN
mgnify:CR=1 FL=1